MRSVSDYIYTQRKINKYFRLFGRSFTVAHTEGVKKLHMIPKSTGKYNLTS